MNLPDAHRIKQAVRIPVLCTGGFQTATVIEQALADGLCHGVTIARPLIANNDLVKMFAAGADARREAVHLLQQVPGQRRRESARLLRRSRFASHDEMVRRSCRSSSRRRSREGRSDASSADPRCARRWRAPCAGLHDRAQGADALPDSDSFPDADDISSTARSAPRSASAFRTGSGRCCRRSSRTSCRSVRASATSASASCRTRRDTRVRSATSYKSGRVARVGLNCATCHVGTYRETPTSPRQHRLRHARQPDGPAGLRELPDRVRQRPALQLRDADGGHPQGEPGHRLVRPADLQALRRSARRSRASSSARATTRGSTGARRSVPAASTRSTPTR